MRRVVSIVVLLFVLIAIGVYLLGKNNAATSPLPASTQRIVSVTPTLTPPVTLSPAPSDSASSAMSVVHAFYSAYTSCLMHPPAAASGHVSTYCQAHTGYTSTDFEQNITAGGTAQAGADPIICAQNPPQTIQAISASPVSSGQTTVTVEESYGDGTKVTIPVTVRHVADTWKVATITCPRP